MDFLRQYGFSLRGVILAAVLAAAAAPSLGQTTAPASQPAGTLVGGRESRLVSKGQSPNSWQGIGQTLGALAVVSGIMIA